MDTFDYIVLYLITAVVFTAVDLVWLGKVAPKIYKKYIGHLMAKKPNKPAALLFYSTFIVGLLIFVLVPAINADSIGRALGYGALYGFFTYATFDLTSQAVFKNWPSRISQIDITWGIVLSTVVCGLSFIVYTSIF